MNATKFLIMMAFFFNVAIFVYLMFFASGHYTMMNLEKSGGVSYSLNAGGYLIAIVTCILMAITALMYIQPAVG